MQVGHAVAQHAAENITKYLGKEMEVDYTGLLLIASAGYDPRNAQTICEKLGKISSESPLSDYLCTHPSGKK
ncbi:unnamed protein product [Citrullus colocynthis]|uniref:Peptidase M48 domain-containing protein n=1 Tax=Citrullus colocynthis TaxID=252529 RepID=A0ABP0YCX6_9ROSI